MLRRALDAFIGWTSTRPRRSRTRTTRSTSCTTRSTSELIDAHDRASRSTIDRATWLLWAATTWSASPTACTNICERIIYKATGELVEINVSSY